MMTLGCKKPQIILYLPNRPLIPQDGGLDVPALIELNGNHWRKIFSIYAKLCCNSNDWRNYRDDQLLKTEQQISFSNQLSSSTCWHLIAGKASWHRILGIDDNPAGHGFSALDSQKKLWHKGCIILSPYLDYRQFPNALIDDLIQFMSKEGDFKK